MIKDLVDFDCNANKSFEALSLSLIVNEKFNISLSFHSKSISLIGFIKESIKI